jgi:acetylornithine deacetylase
MTELHQRIVRSVEEHRPTVIAFLQDLIKAPSVTGQEGVCAVVCAEKLTSMGLEVDTWDTDPTELRAHPAANPSSFSYEGRPNVVGRYQGANPASGRSLMLNGHIDVVTAEPVAKWTHDPWGGEIAENKLYGRGANDMKGGIACMVVALQSVLAAGLRPAGDVLVECVIEEEEGVGNGTLASLLRGYTADACIVTEATDLRVQPAMRGAIRWKITVEGQSSHGVEKWKGVDGIEKGFAVWQSLRYFQDAMSGINSHPYFAEYPISIPVTPDVIRAGAWRGMVAPDCVIEGYLETLPGHDTAYWEEQFRSYLHAVASTDPWLRNHVPRLEVTERYEAYAEDDDSPFVAAMQCAATEVLGEAGPLSGLNGGCDAYIRHVYGHAPTVVFGPTGDRAHGADEYVDIDSLVAATKVMALTIADWCGIA